MRTSIQEAINVVHDLHTYRDGTLPLVKQEFHQPTIEILRCSHWLISVWDHSNLSAPYWRLYWNQDSGAVARLGGTDYLLDPDCLVLIAPNTPFRTFLGDKRNVPSGDNVMVGCPYDTGTAQLLRKRGLKGMVRHFFMHFTAGPPYDSIGPRIFRIPAQTVLVGMLRSLTQSMLANPGRFDHQQSLTQMHLIYYCLACIPEKHWPDIPSDRRVIRAKEFLDTHLQNQITNAELANLVGMSANAFVRLFKNKTGQTPLEYFRKRRIERASILLHHTDETIDEIAEEIGFCNRHYFSKVFAEIHGVGPATYRMTRLS